MATTSYDIKGGVHQMFVLQIAMIKNKSHMRPPYK